MKQEDQLCLGVIGCGGIATQQVAQWVKSGKVQVVAGVEPDADQFGRFSEALGSNPQNAPTVDALLENFGADIDAVYIATPHAYHAEQAIASLRAGLNVLLEKPMAFRLSEAEAIQVAERESGKVLVVSFNGSLSPKLRATTAALAAGEFGRILAISGIVSENWASLYDQHWKQKPDISGGGFLLDSGSHAINAIIDVAGCGIETISAQFSGTKPSVEITAAISGKMQNGALLTLTACGNTVPPCLGELTLFCENAILRVDPWGNRPTLVRKENSANETEIPFGKARQLIDLFQDVCAGRLENPSPVDRNVEFARLWAAARMSAEMDGKSIHISALEGL